MASSVRSRLLHLILLFGAALLLLSAPTLAGLPLSPASRLILGLLAFSAFAAGSFSALRLAAQIQRLALALKTRKAVAPNAWATELQQIANSYRELQAELEKTKRNFKEIGHRLAVYERELAAEKRRLQLERQLRNKLGRYVGHNVVEQLVRQGIAPPEKTERRNMTMLFSDIRSFTTISEQMTPEEVVAMLNEYFNVMTEIIHRHGGVVDKFVGDEIMAVFGHIGDPNDAPLHAVHAAIDMLKGARSLMAERNARGEVAFEIGIGINTGDVVVGNVGAEHRMDYTVIGDAVNVAARLQQRAEGQEILISDTTYEAVKRHIKVRPKGEIRVKNRIEPVKVYQVVV